MATQRQHDQWADDMIQRERRRPMLIGIAALAGVVVMILVMLYAFTQLSVV